MRYTVRLTVIFALVTVLLFTAFPALGKQDQPRRPGALLYKIREGATHHELGALNGVLNSLGVSNRKVLRGIGVNLDEYPAGLMSEEAACEKLKTTGAVDFAEPDYIVAPDLIPDDTYYAYQWQHGAIHAPEAWDIITGDPSVIVAVCDSGISSTHPDLAENLILPGYNTADDSTNTEPVFEHGTGVAGCLCAAGDNGLGVTGVAWSVGILPIRITNNSNGTAYFSDAGEGIIYAADYGARVVNLSYRMAYSNTINAAAQYLREQGGLLFVSAGNDGYEQGWTDFESFITVGATTITGEKQSDSNYGEYIDLVAPGEGVYSTTGADGYGYMSGTSFASPIAAGVAALVFAFDPSFTPDQVENFLFAACSDLGDEGEDVVFGHGLVDAAETLYLAGAAVVNDSPVAVISVTPSEGLAPLAVTADGNGSYDPDGSVVSWSWDFGDGSNTEGAYVTHVYQAAGTYTATLTVQDDGGATDTETVTITVLTSGSVDPVIFVETLSLEPVQVKNGEIGRAAVTVVDGQNQPVPEVLVWGEWSGLAKNKERGITDAAGRVVFDSRRINKSGTLTFTVTDLSCYGYVYDPVLNSLTSVSLEWP